MKELISIEVERDKHLTFKIKTCKEWEDWLSLKPTLKSDNAFEKKKKIEYYNIQFPWTDVDSIDRGILRGGYFNWAMLKCKGISEGLVFETDELTTLENLEAITKRFIDSFKRTFNQYIKKAEIKVSLTTADL